MFRDSRVQISELSGVATKTKGDEVRAAMEGQVVEATVGSLASTPAERSSHRRAVAVGEL